MKICFEKATHEHIDTIFGWLAEDHVQEFWDNSQGHKDDIINFIEGRKSPSPYCDGKYTYWIARSEDKPFAMLMIIQETHEDNIDRIKLEKLSKTGHTYGLDYMIGDKNYIGKGYGAKTLAKFIDYFRQAIDPQADTFLIDPSSDNPRAKNVYMKAGFEHVADFVMRGDCSGAGKLHHLLIKSYVLAMNHNHLIELVKRFKLGEIRQEPQRVYGGLLHTMCHLETTGGSYAVKQLSKDIKLMDKDVVKNYELTETIASKFANFGIPAIHAIKRDNRFLSIIDNTGYLLYPWAIAKPLDKDAINQSQALEIARILAKMHNLNLNSDEVGEPKFDVHENQQIVDFVNSANNKGLIFSAVLTENLNFLLEINKDYRGAIAILKKHTVISHGDLDQKNVLWNNETSPLLIDWESARKLNPTYEIINAALDWSGITTEFNIDLFGKMIKTYKEAGGIIDNDILEAAFLGVFGNWINWMLYNIKRVIESEDLEQRMLGTEQVSQVLPTILRLKNLMSYLQFNLRKGVY